ncbi:MAG: molybdopterin-binding protein, partial [Pseudomonadota bacterium]
HLANALTQQGIDLKEVRIVPDEEDQIVDALNALRERHTHVFTSGGIGPTHDDITADAVAMAFGVAIGPHPKAMEILTAHYEKQNLEFTPARQRMARAPDTATLIDNPVSKAPGFKIGNVYVMAGVPAVFNAMLENVLATLEGGTLMQSETIICEFGEGTIGDDLGAIQKDHPDTSIGSYPKFDGKTFSTHIVVRSREAGKIEAAAADVAEMISRIRNKSDNTT